MGLEAVKNEIIEQARKKESTLIAEAKKDSEKIILNSQAKASKEREKIGFQTESALKNLERQDKASIILENKKSIMEAQRDITSKVIETVKAKINNLEESKREKFIKKLLSKAQNDIKIGTIYCNKKDIGFLKDLNTREYPISGGIIAETKDGTVRVDYSFDSLLQSIIDNEVQEINNILFK
jgi:V/A-type H+/Na+-transporting ATPase subunit E